MMLLYNAASVAFYTVTPYLFRMSGATFFNLSLLTSDIYGLAVGVFLFKATMTFWYPIAFVWIVGGIVVYNLRRPIDMTVTRRISLISLESGEDKEETHAVLEEGSPAQTESIVAV